MLRSQRLQDLRVGRDPGLNLVDHHAAGHARPHMQDHLVTDSKLRAGPVILEELRLGAGVDDDVGAKPTVIDSSADQALDRGERRRRQQMERRLIVVLDRALRQQRKSLTKGCGECLRRGRVIDSVLDSLGADQDGNVVVNLCPGPPPIRPITGRKRRVRLPLAIPPSSP